MPFPHYAYLKTLYWPERDTIITLMWIKAPQIPGTLYQCAPKSRGTQELKTSEEPMDSGLSTAGQMSLGSGMKSPR